MQKFEFNRQSIKIYKLGEEPKDHIYWLGRPAAERISAIEFLRKQQHPENGPDSGLQRVYTITKLK